MKNNLKVGDLHLEEWIPTLEDVKKYTILSGDYNPIHINIEAARNIGKENMIVHGNLTCSVISKIIGMSFPGKGSLILEQNMSFPHPIYPDDLIKIELIIESVNYRLNVVKIKIKAYKILEGKQVSTVLRGNILCQV